MKGFVKTDNDTIGTFFDNGMAGVTHLFLQVFRAH